ncbi:hypothetical protein QQS21_001433 [Conoideocrella luteorostrata]|uniref:Uncharacterized protein n=1 Tax=Conoideocrella luteorostrata TaxID=1105319 RepID=A0AAJ0G1U9_9HYPO|nr:hypothetical protein QQS21_001433 [Conoideocrella luteorostrata]
MKVVSVLIVAFAGFAFANPVAMEEQLEKRGPGSNGGGPVRSVSILEGHCTRVLTAEKILGCMITPLDP